MSIIANLTNLQAFVGNPVGYQQTYLTSGNPADAQQNVLRVPHRDVELATYPIWSKGQLTPMIIGDTSQINFSSPDLIQQKIFASANSDIPAQTTTSLTTYPKIDTAMSNVVWHISNPNVEIFTMGQVVGQTPEPQHLKYIRIKSGVSYNANQLLGTMYGTFTFNGVNYTTPTINMYANESATATMTRSVNAQNDTFITTFQYQVNGGSWTTFGATAEIPFGATVKVRATFSHEGMFSNHSYSIAGGGTASMTTSSQSPVVLTSSSFTMDNAKTITFTASGYGIPQCLLAGQELIVDEKMNSKLVEDIKVGDKVFTAHEITGEFDSYEVIKAEVASVDNWFEIITESGKSIKCSPTHLLMINNVKKPAQQLSLDDSLMILENGKFVNEKIFSIQIFEEKVNIYQIEVDKAHTYLTTNMIFHHNIK